MLVGDFGVNANDLGMIKRLDEGQISSSGWKVDVRARLIRLRLERELVTVALVDRILAEVIERLAKSLDRFVGPPACIRLDAFTSSPHHKDRCSQLSADVHRLHRLLNSVRSDARIVRGERAVTKHRVIE